MIDWAGIVVSVPLKTSEVLETSEVWHIFIIMNPPWRLLYAHKWLNIYVVN